MNQAHISSRILFLRLFQEKIWAILNLQGNWLHHLASICSVVFRVQRERRGEHGRPSCKLPRQPITHGSATVRWTQRLITQMQSKIWRTEAVNSVWLACGESLMRMKTVLINWAWQFIVIKMSKRVVRFHILACLLEENQQHQRLRF